MKTAKTKSASKSNKTAPRAKTTARKAAPAVNCLHVDLVTPACREAALFVRDFMKDAANKPTRATAALVETLTTAPKAREQGPRLSQDLALLGQYMRQIRAVLVWN